jgi:uncharacterized glyoxalase superfamily protein PhnB
MTTNRARTEEETMSSTTGPVYGGLVPYLFYDDVLEMLEWYARVFGWVERSRWTDGDTIHNAEMTVGTTELWLDGGGRHHLEHDGRPHAMWVGVWVDDVDAMRARIRAAGVDVAAPEDKPYGVRMVTVEDPAGYQWGFMTRTADTPTDGGTD